MKIFISNLQKFLCIAFFILISTLVITRVAKSAELANANEFFARVDSLDREFEQSEPPITRQDSIQWLPVDTGLDYFIEKMDDVEQDGLIVIRINPELYVFSLHMASEEGQALSLSSWADLHGLDAAINASMFLPDKLTSIGHMQSSTHVNNHRIGGRLGAFFLAEPLNNLLPRATIVERDTMEWDAYLPQYAIRVQNFRVITNSTKILWNSDSREYSIAAIANDKKNNIFFILCQYPLTGAAFAKHILSYGLDLHSVIYVEGGEKAALFLRNHAQRNHWVGRSALFNLEGNPSVSVPNIIGIKKR